MKTAEEWMQELGGQASTGEHPPLITINRMAIREIQLDAMKEGMLRAAEVATRSERGPINVTNILTAANQLTEKDII